MLEKLKKLQVNFALVAFLSYTVKTVVVTAAFPDSIIMAVLASVYGYTQYLKRFQPYNLDKAVHNDLIEVKSALSKLNMIRATEKAADRKYF